MNITRDNYEPFFLDYLEGNLQENMIDQFLDFLENNPDLKKELHLFEYIRLPEEHINFSGKEQLYKSSAETKAQFENQTIAYLEGDMEYEDRKSFETYLSQHPELQKEYDLFSKTRLKPDIGIIYQGKNKLYKKSGSVILMNWVTRAAAVLVLLWGINSVIQMGNQPGTQNSGPVIAEVNEKPVEPVKKNDSDNKVVKTDAPEKLKTTKVSKSEKTKSLREQTKGRMEETRPADSNPVERDLTAPAPVSPILAQLDRAPLEAGLAVSGSVNVEKINDRRNIMTIEEFLASRAKKVGNEGLLSAQRIARVGLGFASELSGDRIGYSVKDGKISSLGFESKLLAFSIPLEKK
ncbi:MAG TPA: hypothetical protein DCR40_09030 [Prolixibacteraceae bacterium]|nr:hypothetical protein [Prolixibacteraceae bacterium]